MLFRTIFQASPEDITESSKTKRRTADDPINGLISPHCTYYYFYSIGTGAMAFQPTVPLTRKTELC